MGVKNMLKPEYHNFIIQKRKKNKDDDFRSILFTSYINLFHLKALGSIGNDTLPESFKKIV